MFENFEEKIFKNEKAIQGLNCLMDSINREIDDLFDSQGIKPDLIEQYLSDKSHFSQTTWEKIQTEREKHETHLKRSLNQVVDPRKKRPASISPYWIPIK